MTLPTNRLIAPVLGVLLTAVPAAADQTADCTFDGLPLWGTVRVVDSHYADLDVRVVDSYGDLLVRVVDSYPDACGEWELVDSHYADLDIEWVDSYPGLP